MGRREGALDRNGGPAEAFAYDLRELRRQAGSPSYQALALKAYCSKSALAAAASGRALPSLVVTLAYVAACGGDVRHWEARWHELTASTVSAGPSPEIVAAPTGPDIDGPVTNRPDPEVVAAHQIRSWRPVSRLLSIVPVLGQRRWQSTALGPQDDSLDHLALEVQAQWAAEAENRGLNHPYPLPMRWSVTTDTRLAWTELAERPLEVDHISSRSGRLDGIAYAFEQIPNRRMLVLGDPGSGKTILAIQLVRELLKRRLPGDPVPVLFSIASWNPDVEHIHT